MADSADAHGNAHMASSTAGGAAAGSADRVNAAVSGLHAVVKALRAAGTAPAGVDALLAQQHRPQLARVVRDHDAAVEAGDRYKSSKATAAASTATLLLDAGIDPFTLLNWPALDAPACLCWRI